MITLSDQPFDPGALLSAFSRNRQEIGAVATFTGLARADAGETAVLELEAYPGFTEAVEVCRATGATVAATAASIAATRADWESISRRVCMGVS